MNTRERKRQEDLEEKYEVSRGMGYPMGAGVFQNLWVQFTVKVPGCMWCRLHLYHKKNKKKNLSLFLGEKYRTGCIFSVYLKLPDYEDYRYEYESEKGFFADPCARYISDEKETGKAAEGESRVLAEVRRTIPASMTETDTSLWRHEINDLIIYRLHPKGFTKHSSSKVKAKGTFLGIQEKIPYLLDLGVNAVELMPCYDFKESLECSKDNVLGNRFGYTDKVYPREYFRRENEKESSGDEEKKENERKNYWGYTEDAFYFAPKVSYAHDRKHPEREFMQMVNALHEAGIEVIMEMYFPSNYYPGMIVNCLRYWSHYFSIDGFHLSNANSDAIQAVKDPYLTDIKIFADGWPREVLKERFDINHEKNAAVYSQNFMITARKFLKGDEGMVPQFVDCLQNHPPYSGAVNYMANTNGFTMMDMVSYDRKHNEDNKEDNRDGTDYNYSWNCGMEGPSRKKNVRDLRKKQLKNAFMMLYLSQGIPLIMAGDEFGNSQMGNNNAYCQDNEVSWINWRQTQTAFGKEIHDFVKELISIRKNAPHFHGKIPLRKMDYLNCGYPDFSLHGAKAWYPDYSNYSRFFGAMITGKYFGPFDKEGMEDYFVAFNMYWEPQNFGLPVLSPDRRWKYVLSSCPLVSSDLDTDNKRICLGARSAALLVSEKVKRSKKEKKRENNNPARKKK